MSAARRRRALSVFPELKVANFVSLLSICRTENRINVIGDPAIISDPAFICTFEKNPAFNRDLVFNGDPAIIRSYMVNASCANKVEIHVTDGISNKVTVKISIRAKVWVGEC